MKIDTTWILLAALVAGAPAMAANPVAAITGTVSDFGAEDANAGGISGVAITVKNARDKEIASGLTDAQGRYRIEVDRSARPFTVYFDKLGYRVRPTVRKVSDATSPQAPVLMVRESAPALYYKAVAARTAASTLSQVERQERIALVVDLPPADKSRVVEEVKRLAAAPALEEIQVAEKSRAIESNVKAKLLADTDVRALAVSVDSTSGVVELNGSVATAEQKFKAADVARSVQGVARVKNELTVQSMTGGATRNAETGSAAPAAKRAR